MEKTEQKKLDNGDILEQYQNSKGEYQYSLYRNGKPILEKIDFIFPKFNEEEFGKEIKKNVQMMRIGDSWFNQDGESIKMDLLIEKGKKELKKQASEESEDKIKALQEKEFDFVA